jgi:hypothetical protein
MSYVTAEQAAAMLGCCASHVRRLVRKGALAGQLWAGRWQVSRPSVERYRPQKRGAPRGKQVAR